MSGKEGLAQLDLLHSVHGRGEVTRDFERAIAEVLEFLKRRIGFMHWLLVRSDNGKRVLVRATSGFHGIKPGQEVRFSDISESDTGAIFISDLSKVSRKKASNDLPIGPIRSLLEQPIYLD